MDACADVYIVMISTGVKEVLSQESLELLSRLIDGDINNVATAIVNFSVPETLKIKVRHNLQRLT